ncbi:cytochrome P450 [Pisolithus orientalis]|uniref:cytochrome P450 n=1 Tax=Pisolithus orientalis TaxID=936130 RepID=UPI002224A3C8|nr:cytochrome P450 [Pisolithus orientalis]KAI5995319.1 cytochrome P450 [Pisolithus orientalis]
MSSLLAFLALLVVIYAALALFLRRKTSSLFPPSVPSALPWIGSALSYLSNPKEFLARCQKQYGSVYKLLLGGREVIVFSSTAAISSVYASEDAAPQAMHNQIFRAFIGRYPKDTGFSVEKAIFPLLDQVFSKRSLEDLVQPLAQMVFARVRNLTQMRSTQVSLMTFLAEPLYFAVNVVLFGNGYPSDSFDDFRVMDETMPERFFGKPYWFLPSVRARRRLIPRGIDYVQKMRTSTNSSALGSDFIQTLQKKGVSPEEAACHLLTFSWGLHANTQGTIFWFFLFLLSDPVALAAVRDEVDRAIKHEFGDLHGFLVDANFKNLDGPSFTLLTSAIMEVMRLTATFMGLRTATSDFNLKDSDKLVPVRKGEYLLGNVDAVHMDDSVYPNSHAFVYDRFVYCEGKLRTDGKPWFSFAAGRHMCKGRYLAMYELKVSAILSLYLFDITPVGGPPPPWWPPRSQRVNLGFPRMEDIIVQLHPRDVAEGI